jgi:hypothetical protein
MAKIIKTLFVQYLALIFVKISLPNISFSKSNHLVFARAFIACEPKQHLSECFIMLQKRSLTVYPISFLFTMYYKSSAFKNFPSTLSNIELILSFFYVLNALEPNRRSIYFLFLFSISQKLLLLKH